MVRVLRVPRPERGRLKSPRNRKAGPRGGPQIGLSLLRAHRYFAELLVVGRQHVATDVLQLEEDRERQGATQHALRTEARRRDRARRYLGVLGRLVRRVGALGIDALQARGARHLHRAPGAVEKPVSHHERKPARGVGREVPRLGRASAVAYRCRAARTCGCDAGMLVRATSVSWRCESILGQCPARRAGVGAGVRVQRGWQTRQGGAALDAAKYHGAASGVGRGPTGCAWALPTKDARLCPNLARCPGSRSAEVGRSIKPGRRRHDQTGQTQGLPVWVPRRD